MEQWMIVVVMGALMAAGAAHGEDRVLLSAESRIQSPESLTLTFDLPELKPGEQVRLALDARLDWPGVNGSNPWFSVNINGHALSGPDLVNKPLDFMMLDGVEASWVRGSLWRTVMSQDFSDRIKTHKYAHAVPWTDPFRFVWAVTRWAKSGQNKVVIHHPSLYAKPTTLVLREIAVEHGAPIPSAAASVVTPAPTGPLPVYLVDNPHRGRGAEGVAGGRGVADGDVRPAAVLSRFPHERARGQMGGREGRIEAYRSDRRRQGRRPVARRGL